MQLERGTVVELLPGTIYSVAGDPSQQNITLQSTVIAKTTFPEDTLPAGASLVRFRNGAYLLLLSTPVGTAPGATVFVDNSQVVRVTAKIVSGDSDSSTVPLIAFGLATGSLLLYLVAR